MAARWLAVGGPRQRKGFAVEPARVRSVLLDRELVSRLCGVLRCLGRRQEIVCGGGAGRTTEASLEKAGGRTGRSRRARLGVSGSDMGARSGAGDLPTRRHTEAAVFDPGTGGGYRQRTGRGGGGINHCGATFIQSPAASTAGSSSATVRVRTLALVTSTTEATTTAVPSTMKWSMRSCRTSHPRKTATTGFT